MSVKILLLFVAGVVYGVVIGVIGLKLMNTAALKATPRNEAEARKLARKINRRWWLKLLFDAAALFVLYKITPMLLGAALGLLLTQKIYIVKTVKS